MKRLHALLLITIAFASIRSQSESNQSIQFTNSELVVAELLNSEYFEDSIIAGQMLYHAESVSDEIVDMTACRLLSTKNFNYYVEPISWLVLAIGRHGNEQHYSVLKEIMAHPKRYYGKGRKKFFKHKISKHLKESSQSILQRIKVPSDSEKSEMVECGNTINTQYSTKNNAMKKGMLEDLTSTTGQTLDDVIDGLGRPFAVHTEAKFYRLWLDDSRTFRVNAYLYFYYENLGVLQLERVRKDGFSYRVKSIFIEPNLSQDWLEHHFGYETVLLAKARAYHAVNLVTHRTDIVAEHSLMNQIFERMLHPIITHKDEYTFQKEVLSIVKKNEFHRFYDAISKWDGGDSKRNVKRKLRIKIRSTLKQLNKDKVKQYVPII